MFDNTRVVFNSLLKKIRLALFITEIIVDVIFTIFYGYLSYSHYGDIIPFVIYIVLASINLLWLIYYSSTYHFTKEEKKKRSLFKNIFKYCSWSLRAIVLGYNVYLLLTTTLTDLTKIFIIISFLALVLQIIFEVVSRFAIKAIKLSWYSFTIDWNENETTRNLGLTIGLDDLLKQQDDDELNQDLIKTKFRSEIEEELNKKVDITNPKLLKFGKYRIKRSKLVATLVKYYLLTPIFLTSKRKAVPLFQDTSNLLEQLKEKGIDVSPVDTFIYLLTFNPPKDKDNVLSKEILKLSIFGLMVLVFETNKEDILERLEMINFVHSFLMKKISMELKSVNIKQYSIVNDVNRSQLDDIENQIKEIQRKYKVEDNKTNPLISSLFKLTAKNAQKKKKK